MARSRARGLKDIEHKITVLAQAGKDANVKGMRVIGEAIMTDVKASRPGAGIPRDEGVLAGSGVVTGPDASDVTRLTFGGAAAPYALIQHENLTFHHTVGEARYLVRGLERFVARGGPLIALKANADAAIEAARRA